MAQARERVHTSVPAERLAAYRTRSAPVDPADVDAFATAHTLWQVAGPDRGRGDLSPEVWELSLDMCRGVFHRQWTGPEATERELPAHQRLHEIDVPTLVINGLSDVPGIQAVSDLLAATIKGAIRIDLPETGHLPPLERPAQVSAALSDFLEESGVHREVGAGGGG